MNKTMNVFKHYNFTQVILALILPVVVSIASYLVVVYGSIQIILLMVPDRYYVITVMMLLLVGITFFAWYLFIDTLKNYKQIDFFDYRTLYLLIAIPISIIMASLSFAIPIIYF